MGIAVLKRTGSLVVGIVTIYHQGSWQGFVPKDLARDTGRTGLAKQKETDLDRGEEPTIAALSIIAPPCLVRMFHRRLTVWFDQTTRNGAKDLCQTMKDFDQRPQADVDLLDDSSHGNAVQIMHGRSRGQQLVSIEAFGQNSRRGRLVSLPTTRTVSLG